MKTVRLLALIMGFLLSSAAVPAQAPATAKAPSGKTAPAASQASADPVDVNHASAAELKALPGIGDAYSLAIIKHRPYKNKTQLRSMGVIPAAAYQKIKDQIVAKQ